MRVRYDRCTLGPRIDTRGLLGKSKLNDGPTNSVFGPALCLRLKEFKVAISFSNILLSLHLKESARLSKLLKMGYCPLICLSRLIYLGIKLMFLLVKSRHG